MPAGSIKAGDIVEVNHKGRIFLAYVVSREKGKQVFEIKPITQNISWRTCTSREIKGLWRKVGR